MVWRWLLHPGESAFDFSFSTFAKRAATEISARDSIVHRLLLLPVSRVRYWSGQATARTRGLTRGSRQFARSSEFGSLKSWSAGYRKSVLH